MKILLFGKNGQVGWELNRSLLPLGEIVALGRDEADFSKPESLRKIMREIQPNVIVNAAAYTAVDKAESEEDLATTINGDAPGVLAEESLRAKALLIHYSTDYVFDGTKSDPYTEDDVPNPINAYGRSKLAGELAIQSSGSDYLIFRTSWVYASRGHNFLLTMLKLAKEREVLSIVSDQTGSPTSARLISDTTALCLKQAISKRHSSLFASGIYHLTTSGSTSWYGFCDEIINVAAASLEGQLKVKNINAITTKNYPTPANRPMNSRLLLSKLESAYQITMPDWKNAIELCVEELT